MRQGIFTIFLLFVVAFCSAQVVDSLSLEGLNTPFDQIPCAVLGDELWCAQIIEQAYYSDFSSTPAFEQRLVPFKRTFSWSNFKPLSSKESRNLKQQELNGMSFSSQDSVLMLSALDSKTGLQQMYSLQIEGQGSGEMRQLHVLPSNYSCQHPFISPSGDQLYFAAKADSTSWDIYFSNKAEGEWQEAKKVRGAVNSGKDEIYPVLRDGDLYFSSNNTSAGDFDLFKAKRRSQWRTVEPMVAPINSKANELNIVFLSDQRFFIGSDRNGNFEVKSFQLQEDEPIFLKYTALLEVKGVPVPFSEVEVFNDLNERILVNQTKEDGKFDLLNMKVRRSYKVKFAQLSSQELEHAALYILNEKGERILVLRPGLDGFFLFEALPSDEMEQLAFLKNEDESQLLSVGIRGELRNEASLPVEKGTPIYIVDENGELLEIAYTREGGDFRFEELTPRSNYRFRLDEKEKKFTMVVMDGDREVVIPIEAGEGFYERVKDTEALRLTNETGEPIVIRKSEVFVFQSIYFEFDQFELTPEAKERLKRLASILAKNPDLSIEITSHTDARGTNDYNLNLSNKRALSTQSYLIGLGVDLSRIQAKGMGEEVLLNECADEVECTEEEHALNRRTEIIFALSN
jgi:outer membrane protein OmpA-like peptidoglycan-associated protein